MLTKKEVLQFVRTLAKQKAITKEELIAAYDTGIGYKDIKKFRIAEILYYIGGAIVFLGIAVLLWQNWFTLGFVTKVLATLGSGMAAYYVGWLFSREEKTKTIGCVFYIISALATPIGLWIVFDKMGLNVNSDGLQSLISAILFITYLILCLVLRKNIFALFIVLFGTWFYFSFTNFIIAGHPFFGDWEFFQYRVLVVSISYLLLGHAFSRNDRVPFTNFLYNFGMLSFLATTLALGGWKPHQNLEWELIYPILVFGALFLSVYMKRRAFLTCSTLFLMVYILKITSEYFSYSLGWPLALAIAGLVIMGAGYISLSIKKKYL